MAECSRFLNAQIAVRISGYARAMSLDEQQVAVLSEPRRLGRSGAAGDLVDDQLLEAVSRRSDVLPERGTITSGRKLPAGVYFVRMRTGGIQRTIPVVHLN